MSFVGDIVGALISADATEDAADNQRAAADQANATNRYFYDTSRSDYAPYRQSGYDALSQINALLGLPNTQSGANKPAAEAPRLTPYGVLRNRFLPQFTRSGIGGSGDGIYETTTVDEDALQSAIEAQIAKEQTAYSQYQAQQANALAQQQAPAAGPANALAALRSQPGYQFGLDQGMQALERSAAARGGLYSGKAMKNSMRFGQDYAGTKLGETFNRLASVAGLGQVATGATSAAGMNAANQIGANQIGVGNALAAAGMARGNIFGNAINSIGAYGDRNGWFNSGGVRNPGQGFQNADWWRGGDGWEGE